VWRVCTAPQGAKLPKTAVYGPGRDGEDVALAEHRDASVATLNLNLNTAGAAREGGEGDAGGGARSFLGSELYFVDEDDPAVHHTVRFEPGMALLVHSDLR
jgi:hypothetical protein